MSTNRHPPLHIAGPTAVGKSAVALELARRLHGEIISVDSMQVYRGLDIGTAKPTAAERAEIPHHLIDIVDLSESFHAAEFVRLASVAVREIKERERLPIFCGGTGLYFQAYFQGLGEAPPADSLIRTELERLTLPELLEELSKKDPVTFHATDRSNRRRVVRALEVIRLTGKPFSTQRARWNPPVPATGEPLAEQPIFFGLTRHREDQHRRIEQRVDAMLAHGLTDEVEALLQAGLARNQTALQALGYRQILEFRQGARTWSETVELIKQKTRQYAKRQMTWFRHQAQLEWFQIEPEEPLSRVADRLEARYVERSGNTAQPQRT